MRRREFIAGLGSAAVSPLAARAQQRRIPVVGFLCSLGLGDNPDEVAAFHKGLGEVGYFEKRNVAIEYRWAQNKNDRLPALARDLVQRNVDVIGAFGNAAPALAAQAATSTIPIVFRAGADPVRAGLVLNRPGGNITGVVSLSEEIGSKRVELLHQMVPSATSVAALVNPTNFEQQVRIPEWEEAARLLGIRLLVVNASSAHEIEDVFKTMVQQNIEVLLAGADAFYFAQRHQLVALAARYRIPALYHAREAVQVGGLMSYGSDLADGFRVAGTYIGRILKGEKPADLPVQQSTKLELVINLTTARMLGLEVPTTLLVLADRVIE